MIKVDINTLMAVKPVLQELANTKMPAKKSFQVLRTLKAVDAEYASIEEVQRNMIMNYGKKDDQGEFVLNEEGTGYLIAEEHQAAFMKEMNELLTSEIELDCAKLSMDLFDTMDLSPNQLMIIESFIEMDEE